MTTITFEVLGEPRPKKRPRVAIRGDYAHAYTPKETVLDERAFGYQSLAHRPAAPLTAPLHVELVFVFGVPESWGKKKTALALSGHIPNQNAKDLDNLTKLALDAMNGIFWIDDRQVCSLTAVKTYGAIPRTCVTIREVVVLAYGTTNAKTAVAPLDVMRHDALQKGGTE